jgi:pimeloyl-ACP methyl ester carboxylesterase
MLCPVHSFRLGKSLLTWIGVLTLLLVPLARSQDDGTTYAFRDGLAIGSVGRSSRNAFHTDAIEETIVRGQWRSPAEGETVVRADGTNRAWKTISADKDGTFTGSELRGGYLYASLVIDTPQTRVLQAAGHTMLYVNGEPRAGDPYSNGTLELPVALHPGTNDFLFSVGRGRLSAKLLLPKAPLYLSARDATLPDIVRGADNDLWCALPLVNSTEHPANDLVILSMCGGGSPVETSLPPIAPMTVRKVPFKVRPAKLEDTNSLELLLKLNRVGGVNLFELANVSLRIRNPTDHYKQTFRSEIDGSIQYYAVVPPNPLPERVGSSALFLSTHGAGVEAMGQADAYAAKSWGYLIAPTNRRPYGFDWEDWGRLDALEVLNLAQKKFQTDPAQTYLTGHSMGGHGAWQLGVTFPDRFAAVAPSAGWISFMSYAGASRSQTLGAVEEIIQRAGTGSDTLALASNYLQHAIYVLHGDKDDNVPVSEARKMKERLSEFHRDFLYHEQPGAGHWWGNACVDWPPIFDLFARRKIPVQSAVTAIRFSTANPGVSSSSHWVTIEVQERALTRSSVDISYDPAARKLTGSTENVARLALRTSQFNPASPVSVQLDGHNVDLGALASNSDRLRLERRAGEWSVSSAHDPTAKGPLRNGPFKEAFNHEMLFVYPTRGTAEENRSAYGKARYDAETWLYRGNGAVDLIADIDFNPAAEPNRSVILYGNADNNAAWAPLLDPSPVQVKRGSIKIGNREIQGEDLACLFLRPRPGSQTASVAVVGGTGVAGQRLTERVPYFLAGVAFPDCTVFGVDSLREGANAVRVAGFFGNDWSVEHGEFAWRD